MSKPNVSLIRTCASCGLQKPLSAFLQIAGTQGTTYGNICSSCRKTHLEKPKPDEPEEATTSRTGVKIDSKAKVQGEIDKREARKQLEEDYLEDRVKEDEKQIHRAQKVDTIIQDEKKRRESFLEKRSFLEQSKKPNSGKPSKVFGGIEQQAKAGAVDFSAGTVEYTQVKMAQSSIFQEFKSWLGSARIVSAAERAATQKHKNKDKAPGPAAAPETDPINEFVNKTRGPGAKG
jgi:hypothetical protein